MVMPGIDFDALRARITMEEVLTLVGFSPARRLGCRLRGRCPFDCSDSTRNFVANLAIRRYRCFGCGRSGNQLDLWADLHGQPFHEAVLVLCQQLEIKPPLIHRW
jgi:DNA primase